ncbi:MAG: ATP-binding protein [Deltaproteobacteria bacterium]
MFKTLKGKISLIYFCLVIFIAIVGTTSVVNLYKLSKAINGLMTDNYKSINAVTYMLEAIERQDSAVLIYINVDRQKGIDIFSDNNNVFLKWFNVESTNITESGEKELVEKINDYYTKYAKLFSEMQEVRNNQGIEKSVDFYNTKSMPYFIKIKQVMKELSLLNERAMFNGKNNATKNAKKSMYTILILSTIAVIGGFLSSRFYINKFLKPMHSLTESVRRVKEGDLNQQIGINSQDEIGELASEFNSMTQRLQLFEQSTLGQLMAEKNKSLAIVKNIADPLIVLDINYKIVLLNNACEKFFDIKEEKVINKHFLETIRNGELFDFISSISDSKEDYKEKIFLIKSQEDYYFNVIVTSVKDIDKNATGIVVVFQNVTELKQLEKIKTDFIATVSHEFKTPLTSIMMGTSLFLEESIGKMNNKQKEIMETIREDGEKLSTLVNDLLEVSKIESGNAVYKMKPCMISDIIETSIKQFNEKARIKEVNLKHEIENGLPKVNADNKKILWVINNLISNALEYTDKGNHIFVNAYARDRKAYVSVKDTGIGIPEEYLQKIFEKYVQVEGYDLEVRGTGLGLAIVKEIIEAHGGEIWCESKVGIGSNFTFTLPLSFYEEF